MNTSTLFKNAVLNLYHQGIYTVDYAIIKTEELRHRNRITEEDYMELLTYFAEEQEKEPQPIPEPVEEISEENTTESTENIDESAEITAEESEVE